MAVPVWADFFGGGVFRSTEDLHEPRAPLDESPRKQTLTTKRANVCVIELVEFFRGGRLAADVGGFGSAELEACGELISCDAGFEFGVFLSLRSVAAIEHLEEITAGLFGALNVTRRRKEVGDGRFLSAGGEHSALMDRRQKASTPVQNAARRQSAWIGQHDESGQVFAQATEAVGDPCAHAGEAWQDEAAVRHEHSGAVQSAFALHGVDKGEVIDFGREFGEEIADPATAVAMLAKLPPRLLAVAGLGREELQFAIGIEGFALTLFELRFVVPGIDMGKAARAEDLDYRPGLRGVVTAL